MWWEEVGVLLTYTLNRLGEISPSSAMPSSIPQQADVAAGNNASNVQSHRQDEMIFRRYEEK
jgi:hypothetical protein